MCILLCSVFNEDTVSFMYLCNDRELIIMNSRLLCDEQTASVYFIWKIDVYFSIGNGKLTEPALCQLLYRHTFFPYPDNGDGSKMGSYLKTWTIDSCEFIVYVIRHDGPHRL